MHMTIQKQQLGCEQKIVAIILISRGARTTAVVKIHVI